MTTVDKDDAQDILRETLYGMAVPMCSVPQEVMIESAENEEGAIQLVLHAGESDKGRLIGRQGRTIEAMRTVLHSVSKNLGVRVHTRVE